MNNINWDQLRIFISIARAGTLTEAARRLKVNHATVFRQLNQFEQDVGSKLFIRSRNGYKLTDFGEALLKRASGIEEDILTLERELLGKETELSGLIRVTTTDTLGTAYLSKHIATFKKQYPQVNIELLVGHATYDLTRREADVAIRTSTQPKGDIIGKRITSIAFAVYGAKDLVGRKKLMIENQFEGLPFLELNPSFAELTSYQWLAKAKNLGRSGIQCNTLLSLVSLAEEGVGLALIPCFHGDTSDKLKRITEPDAALGADLWVLTNKEFQHNSRIRAFMDHMYECLSGDKKLFQG